jgi:hypothetical protein
MCVFSGSVVNTAASHNIICFASTDQMPNTQRYLSPLKAEVIIRPGLILQR